MNLRIQYYDNLRAFACFLVILTHSAMPALNPEFGIFMVLFSLMGSPSSELFVSISSSLLAPTKLSMKEFYKKRFSKLLWPFLFWSIFMVLYRYSVDEIDIQTVYRKIILFPLKATEGIYWFVYVIAALYLINPIISPWLKIATKKEMQFFILIWFITLLLPLLNIITKESIYELNGNYNFILVYMGGFIGYMLIGVYFKKFPVIFKSKSRAFLVVAVFILLGIIPFAVGLILKVSAGELIGNNLSLSSAFFVIAIYLFFKNFKLPSVLENITSSIAKYSFGIYLIHIFILQEVVWKFMKNFRLPHPLLETPIIALTTLAICFLVVKGLSYLPMSEYFIGA